MQPTVRLLLLALVAVLASFTQAAPIQSKNGTITPLSTVLSVPVITPSVSPTQSVVTYTGVAQPKHTEFATKKDNHYLEAMSDNIKKAFKEDFYKLKYDHLPLDQKVQIINQLRQGYSNMAQVYAYELLKIPQPVRPVVVVLTSNKPISDKDAERFQHDEIQRLKSKLPKIKLDDKTPVLYKITSDTPISEKEAERLAADAASPNTEFDKKYTGYEESIYPPKVPKRQKAKEFFENPNKDLDAVLSSGSLDPRVGVEVPEHVANIHVHGEKLTTAHLQG